MSTTIAISNFDEIVAASLTNQGISQGPQGLPGETGETGPKGIQGPQGNDGNDGANGTSVNVLSVEENVDKSITVTWSDGTVFTSTSLKGDKGDVGLTGDKGDTGDAVTIENVSNNGDYTFTIDFSDGTSHTTENLRGLPGATGSTGPKGEQGDDGLQGLQGPQGVQGLQGQKGDDGEEGQGVHHVHITDTTDPEGDLGTPGETDTYTIWGNAGQTINLGSFVVSHGIDGKSAYENAIDGGYTGSEAEFNIMLSGVSGYADSAITSADNAEASAVIATDAAADAVTASDSFTSVYLGSKVTDPVVGNSGESLTAGMVYYNVAAVPHILKIYNGTIWDTAVFAAVGAVNTFNGREGTVTLNNTDVTGAVGVDLSGVEAGATQDQTATEIEALYEGIADTNKYTDAEKLKVATSADGTQTDTTTTKYVDKTTTTEYKIYIDSGELLMEEL